MNLDEFLKVAHQGVPEAQYVVALCFENGWGVAADKTVAEKWLLKSAEQGHAASQHELSLLLQRSSDDPISEAIDWLRKSATQGFPPAEVLYSLYCEGGIGMAPDLTEAFRYSLSAAERGYAPAPRRAASMLEQGIGVAQNFEQALHWYQRAAELGDADAAASVGRMYAQGIGVEQNDAMAMKWLVVGQEGKSPWALSRLSSVYRFGELGQSVDSDRADELAMRAEELLKERAGNT